MDTTDPGPKTPTEPDVLHFGKLTMMFGPSADSEPLSFQAHQINIIVGPNNAGKSLFLRELSGIDPRERSSRHGRGEQPKIIQSADWSTHVQEYFQHSIIESFAPEAPETWEEIRERNWSVLLPRLLECSARLTTLRSRIANDIRAAAESILDPNLAQLARALLENADSDEADTLLIILALVALALPPDRSAIPAAGDTARRGNRHLPPAHYELLISIFETAWPLFCEALALLGVETESLALSDLLDMKSISSVVLTKLRENPIFAALLGAASPPAVDIATADELGKWDRYYTLGQWCLSPSILADLHEALASAYAGCTWSDPDFRAGLSESALFLDGIARLSMTSSGKLSPFDKQESGTPAILTLLKDQERMRILRDLVNDALGLYLVIDFSTQAPKVVWRLSNISPPDEVEIKYSASASEGGTWPSMSLECVQRTMRGLKAPTGASSTVHRLRLDAASVGARGG